MTVPGQQEEEDDDDMPPLEYVGSGTLPAAKTGAVPTAADDDDDDDSMPPLDYVGLAPPKEPEQKPATAAADDDDDDMPPLEYVGTNATQVYSLREGARVRTKGLSTADLNGQTGTILPFVGVTKDRLPVKLDIGKSIKIKPENLEVLPAAGPELTPEPCTADGDSDDSMPPLEVQPQPTATPAAHSQPEAAPADDDDDDEMPPLESNTASAATAKTPVQPAPATASRANTHKAVPENAEEDDDVPPLEDTGVATPGGHSQPAATPADDDDDDEMPPLEYVGSAETKAPAQLAPESKEAPKSAEEDDDDMPPLEYVGLTSQAPPAAPAATSAPREAAPEKGHGAAPAASAPTPTLREGDKVVLKGLSRADLNGQKGVIMSPSALNTSPGRQPVKLDSSGRALSIKEDNLERLADGIAKPQQAEEEEEDDDDDMPPLEYVGTSAPTQPAPALVAKAQEAAADDDDLPPLEPATKDPGQAEEEDDGMPPLHSSSAAPQKDTSAKPTARPPPAAQVPAASTEIKEGDQVVFCGLKKAELNGQKGTVLARAGGDRWPVRLPSGQQALFRPENLQKLTAAAPDDDGDDDDDMPPLEYVGTSKTERAQQVGAVAAEDSDDDAMPPLEYVGTAAPPQAQPRESPSPGGQNVEDDDDDDMPPLEYIGTAAPPAQKQEVEDDDEMPPLEYIGTAAPPQKQEAEDDDDMPPLEYIGPAAPPQKQEESKTATSDAVKNDDDDDDMPPLEYMGTAEPTSRQEPKEAAPQAVENNDDDDLPPLEPVGTAEPRHAQEKPAPAQPPPAQADDDDDMPPLEYVGSTPAGDFCFKDGDEVILKGLGKKELNGQRGTVLPFLKRLNGRLPVLLKGSGNKVSIKPEHLEKVVTASSVASKAQADDEDDDMPPLEYVGSAQPPVATSTPAGAADDGAASDDSMPPLDCGGPAANGALPDPAVGGSHEDSSDSMPPLEHTGQVAASTLGGPEIKAGDFVIIKNLKSTPSLNGERAQVVKADPSELRVRLEVLRTGKKLLVKWTNFEHDPSPDVDRTAGADSDDEAAAKRPPAVPSSTRSPEALLEQMRQAMQSTALSPVVDALAQVESAENVDWGEMLQRKKQLLKKLRAKRKKLQSLSDESPPPADSAPVSRKAEPAAEPAAADARGDKAATTTTRAGPPPMPASSSDKSSTSERDWVVLTPGTSPAAAAATAASAASTAAPAAQPRAAPRQIAAALREWCEELQLPPELVSVLEAEEVTDPLELTGVTEEELMALTKGWKMGPKGRFMKAVRRMRAAEEAELGSTCGSLA